MEIRDFLREEDVAIDFPASDKNALLEALAAHAGAALDLPADAITDALEQRDELGSTGIGDGVCLPHARFRDVQEPFGMFVRLKQPIDYDASDGESVDLAFLLLLPASSQPDQLDALATVARALRVPKTLQRLREAENKAAFYAAAIDG